MSKLVYVISQGDEFYKIGYAIDPISRLKYMQTGNASALSLRMAFDLEECSFDDKILELALHEYYHIGNIRGEWFTKQCYEDLANKNPDDILRMIPQQFRSDNDQVHIVLYHDQVQSELPSDVESGVIGKTELNDFAAEVGYLKSSVDFMLSMMQTILARSAIADERIERMEKYNFGIAVAPNESGKAEFDEFISYINNWTTEYLPRKQVTKDIYNFFHIPSDIFDDFAKHCGALYQGMIGDGYRKSKLLRELTYDEFASRFLIAKNVLATEGGK